MTPFDPAFDNLKADDKESARLPPTTKGLPFPYMDPPGTVRFPNYGDIHLEPFDKNTYGHETALELFETHSPCGDDPCPLVFLGGLPPEALGGLDICEVLYEEVAVVERHLKDSRFIPFDPAHPPRHGLLVVIHDGRNGMVRSVSLGWLEDGALPSFMLLPHYDYTFAFRLFDGDGTIEDANSVWVRPMVFFGLKDWTIVREWDTSGAFDDELEEDEELEEEEEEADSDNDDDEEDEDGEEKGYDGLYDPLGNADDDSLDPSERSQAEDPFDLIEDAPIDRPPLEDV